jgi:hypothetical protein
MSAENAVYRTFDDAIRDGWWISAGPGKSWWSTTDHKYHVTAKRDEYHVELAGDSLSALRAEVRRLRGVPLPLKYTREWWAAQR